MSWFAAFAHLPFAVLGQVLPAPAEPPPPPPEPQEQDFATAAWEWILPHWRSAIEILILASFIYFVYRHFRNTRGAQILTGLLFIMVALTLISQLLELAVIGWLVKSFSVFLAIGLVVIFQPELRRALADLGSHKIFRVFNTQQKEFIDELGDAVRQLSNKRFGALFAIEQGIDLKPYYETGVEIDGELSTDLLLTIFHPKTALHDGGIVIIDDRIQAAGCVFPVSQKEIMERTVGLRHRAALGITEETDAIAIVVSEETGQISICHHGVLEQNLKPDVFKKRLYDLFFEDVEPDREGSDDKLEN